MTAYLAAAEPPAQSAFRFTSPVPLAMPDDGLMRGAASEAGIDGDRIIAFLDDVSTDGLDLHGFMLHRHGKVVAEGWSWPYGPERPRVLHSIAKSFTACAIGMAIDAGLLRLDDTVHSFFPECFPAPVTGHLATMTVEDLLTMRTGHEANVSGAVWRAVKTSWIAEFFKIPVIYPPGSHYVYTSAASYMLSAILTRVTGMTMYAWLKPRLFAPLGIHGESWEESPDGVTPGGNGLTAKTADLLKLGILHAQDGVWNGRRLLPEGWVALATRAHGGADSRYGYHWWRRPEAAYSAIGVFVQMSIVWPESGVTLAIIAGMKGTNAIVPHLDKHFPAAFSGTGSAAADARLHRRLDAMREIPAVASVCIPDHPPAACYDIDTNAAGVTEIRFDFTPEQVQLTLRDASGRHTISAALDAWQESRCSFPGRDLHHGYEMVNTPVVSNARWTDAQTLELQWIFAETAFRDTVVCRFDGTQLTLTRSVAVNSGRLQDDALTGHLRS